MRIVLPLPFAELQIDLRRTRRTRPMVWYLLLSAAFHVVFVSLLVALAVRSLLPSLTQKPPQEIVAISSSVRIEHRAHPVPARAPAARPRTVAVVQRPRAVQHVVRQQRAVRQQRLVPKQQVVAKTPSPRPELAKIVKTATVAYAKPATTLDRASIESQTQAFEQTIAQAKAENDPVAGAATDNVTPSSTKRYTLNIQGTFGRPQPEGILYPLKRWTDGGYVYYYVRYLAEYADGTTESGVVPWPIRFPENADPFARGIHRMPLPGPLPDYVADVTSMTPLVKNCYDHHYSYCPIEHE